MANTSHDCEAKMQPGNNDRLNAIGHTEVLLFTAIAFGFAILTSSPAFACTPPDCSESRLWPASESKSPANTPLFTFRPEHFHTGTAEIQVTAEDIDVTVLTNDGHEAAPFEIVPTNPEYPSAFELRPTEELEPGQTYRIRAPAICEARGVEEAEQVTQARFHATQAAPMPTKLGELSASPARRRDLWMSTADDSCYGSFDTAALEVSLRPATEAEPWLDTLDYAVYVRKKGRLNFDGDRWYSDAYTSRDNAASDKLEVGPGGARLFTECGETDDEERPSGLEPGEYSVMVRGTLPGTDVEVESERVDVELRCDVPRYREGCGCSTGDSPPTGGLLLTVGWLLFARRRE